jgi:5-methylcytosine-specific restriction endonuclease McrA
MKRTPIPYAVQLEVFYRDHWLCSQCRRPTVFHPALRLLGEFVSDKLPGIPLAYWSLQWRRDASPLLDELAASVDHIDAISLGGPHSLENFATICWRCNIRKGTQTSGEYSAASNPWKVKGKYGEPTAWDGFASTFLVLAKMSRRALKASEKGWLRALEERLVPPDR